MERRIRNTRTKSYLVDALLDLSKDKSIYKVGVRELCEKAQINRATFYRQFEGMPDFIERIIDDFIADMDEYIGNGNVFEPIAEGDPDPLVHKCVELMVAHTEFLRVMLGQNGSFELQSRIIESWTRQINEVLEPRVSRLRKDISADFLANYIVSVMWGGLLYTIKDDMRFNVDYLTIQMSTILYDCAFKPLGLVDVRPASR